MRGLGLVFFVSGCPSLCVFPLFCVVSVWGIGKQFETAQLRQQRWSTVAGRGGIQRRKRFGQRKLLGVWTWLDSPLTLSDIIALIGSFIFLSHTCWMWQREWSVPASQLSSSPSLLGARSVFRPLIKLSVFSCRAKIEGEDISSAPVAASEEIHTVARHIFLEVRSRVQILSVVSER